MRSVSHNQIRELLTDDALDQMRSSPGLNHLVDFMLDSFDKPVDPKTGMVWAKPFFDSPQFRTWLGYDQLSFGEVEAELAQDYHRKLVITDRDSSFVGIFIDGDGWKKINYVYGHDGGDDAIVSLGSYIRTLFRPEDHVLRMGGDEFIVLAKNVPTEDLIELECSIDDRLSRIDLTIAGESVVGSATAGFAACPMGFVRSKDLGFAAARETIVRADNALVHAKSMRQDGSYFEK